jgi:iron(II)-dependent oxidoreductase
VGCYPNGASPCGALDMSGNVYEWTATPWNVRSLFAIDSRPSNADAFVCRGGAWPFSISGARCAARYSTVPQNRSEFIGLRLACHTR